MDPYRKQSTEAIATNIPSIFSEESSEGVIKGELVLQFLDDPIEPFSEDMASTKRGGHQKMADDNRTAEGAPAGLVVEPSSPQPLIARRTLSATDVRNPIPPADDVGREVSREQPDREQCAANPTDGDGRPTRDRSPVCTLLVRSALLCFATLAAVSCVLGLVTWHVYQRPSDADVPHNVSFFLSYLKNISALNQDGALAVFAGPVADDGRQVYLP